MTEKSEENLDTTFLNTAVEALAEYPYLICALVVGVVFVWKLPEIIKASGELWIGHQRAKAEVAAQKAVVDSKVKSLEDKRLRKKRRQG